MNNIPPSTPPPPTSPLGKSGDKDFDSLKNHDKHTCFFLANLSGRDAAVSLHWFLQFT